MFDFLKGYKSIIGCVGLIAAFVGFTATQLADGFQIADIEPILRHLAELFVAIGLTGKAIAIETTLKK